jgi:hypothetical protein
MDVFRGQGDFSIMALNNGGGVEASLRSLSLTFSLVLEI